MLNNKISSAFEINLTGETLFDLAMNAEGIKKILRFMCLQDLLVMFDVLEERPNVRSNLIVVDMNCGELIAQDIPQ